ncbi:MAG: GTP-binding protein [Acidimicrobiales bacterium]
MTTARIPLTVVGGYLGAGKTTLINRILTGEHGRRIAVIVNDFGDVAIDESLIVGAEGGVRALANGCVCCSAVDGLATALAEVAGLEPAPEHLVIEVSGVGDPWAVAQWGRTPGYELDGVVVVVDPFAIRRWADDRYVGDTVRGQLASADVVVVSHADDAPPDMIIGVQAWLRDLVDGPVLVGAAHVLELVAPRSAGRASAPPAHAQHRAHDFVPRSATRAEVQEWLAGAPPTVVRVKGFVDGPDGAFVAQRFGHRDEIRRCDPGAEPWVTVITVGTDDVPTVTRWCAALS